eukprot:SAG22_NODE_8978_length_617_cov_0.849421_1_plen_64_part_10
MAPWISHQWRQLLLLLLHACTGCCLADVQPDGYDCRMRQLALSYTEDVVLGVRGGWPADGAASS